MKNRIGHTLLLCATLAGLSAPAAEDKPKDLKLADDVAQLRQAVQALALEQDRTKNVISNIFVNMANDQQRIHLFLDSNCLARCQMIVNSQNEVNQRLVTSNSVHGIILEYLQTHPPPIMGATGGIDIKFASPKEDNDNDRASVVGAIIGCVIVVCLLIGYFVHKLFKN